MKFFLMVFFILSHSANAAINPVKIPTWSDLERYESKTEKTIPFLNKNFIAFAGFNYGFKNGSGFDGTVCKTLSRYLCGGARFFLGSLKSDSIVRTPTALDVTQPTTSEFNDILAAPESWVAFVPEIGLRVSTQIIPLADDQWSETAWFGFGKAFIGGRSGWAISFEPGINKKFKANGSFGWSLRGKYTFGWLYPINESPGTIPFDWFNLTAGIFYTW